MQRRTEWLVLAGVLVSAGWLARADGGGRDPEREPPRAPAVAPSPQLTPVKGETTGSAAVRDVRLRLIELLGDARIDAPAPGPSLQAYWRKMAVPWVDLPPNAARHAWSVALRTSDDEEKEWKVDLAGGRVWTPETKVWNMSEGSYDQREAIAATGAATFAFQVKVPEGARLEYATALLPPVGKSAVRFVVSALAQGAPPRELCSHRVEAGKALWHDEACDLSSLSGKAVELRLTTEAAEGSAAGATATALWGNPRLTALGARTLYNVLWVVIDALRSDVPASFHDEEEDAQRARAEYPPLDALLPRIPGLMPHLDGLATGGVRFLHAYSNATWTRAGTIAMLSGSRSSEAGVDPLPWTISEATADRFYRGKPPLIARALRGAGVSTRAFVNNYFMAGYAQVGLDTGFERVDDERYRTRDTAEITRQTVAWLRANADTRFFVFCNYNSPHEPLDPPKRMVERIPPAPAGPREGHARLYMAEGAKDDEALGQLLATLDELKLRDDTLIIVTADHGETLSAAHDGIAKLDNIKIRFHHAVTNYEETTKIPLLLHLPKALPAAAVKARVRLTDIAPTILDLEKLPIDPRMSGRSLVGLARGKEETDPRLVVTEGRGITAVIWGKYRLMVREGAAQEIIYPDRTVTIPEELYDLENDPGERHNLARARPEIVAELKARLAAANKNVPAAGTAASLAPEASKPAVVSLRFATAGKARRVGGTVSAPGARLTVEPVGIAREALRVDGARVELAFVTSADAPVGFDLKVDPPGTDVTWEVSLDDAPWPATRVFAGPFGLHEGKVARGLVGDEARVVASAERPAEIDAARDLGLFVTVTASGTARGPSRALGAEGAKEMNRLLKDWGYAHGPK